jgi:hypothetical protein
MLTEFFFGPMLMALALLALAATAWVAIAVEALFRLLELKWRNYQRRKSFGKLQRRNRGIYSIPKD